MVSFRTFARSNNRPENAEYILPPLPAQSNPIESRSTPSTTSRRRWAARSAARSGCGRWRTATSGAAGARATGRGRRASASAGCGRGFNASATSLSLALFAACPLRSGHFSDVASRRWTAPASALALLSARRRAALPVALLFHFYPHSSSGKQCQALPLSLPCVLHYWQRREDGEVRGARSDDDERPSRRRQEARQGSGAPCTPHSTSLSLPALCLPQCSMMCVSARCAWATPAASLCLTQPCST